MNTEFLKTTSPKTLLAINAGLSILYLYVITFFFPHGNPILFTLLIGGQIFHVWQALTYVHTVWETNYKPKKNDRILPGVDVFITVAGEPLEIISETAKAARDMDYPNFKVYILNDGFVANKENWKDVENLAQDLGVGCITRRIPGGAKAGNINHAVIRTSQRGSSKPLVAIFDADHVPHKDFLKKTVPYFTDPDLGFVQTPQYYKNYDLNLVTQGSWQQQQLFFGAICKGKNRLNSVTMCGTNMLIRRRAIFDVGGLCEDSVAEDFVTGMFMHENGWKSVYHGEVLAEGLAPEDFLSYYKQQLRWARGALDVLFKYRLIFRKGLSLTQKMQYLSSSSFYLSGLVVIMNALLPVIFFYTGLVPIEVSTMLLALVFLPYIFLTVYVLQITSNYSFTFQSLAFSMSSFVIHIQAIFSALTGAEAKFDITSKRALNGNFIRLVVPHIIYILLVAVGIGVATEREGLSASVVNNTAWAMLNIAVFLPFIFAAAPQVFDKRNIDTAGIKEGSLKEKGGVFST